MKYALGKLPPKENAVKIKFEYVFDMAKLPDPPKEFWVDRR